MKKVQFLGLLGLVVSLCLLPLGCLVDEEESLSTSEQSIAQNVAAFYSFSFKALNARLLYDSGDTSYQRSGCPTIHWYDVCNWVIDFGEGCTASDGNYYSGSIEAIDCEEIHYSSFCQNEYCIDGYISFTTDVTCEADVCYQEIIEATLSGPDDTVTVYQNAVAGATGETCYLFAPATVSVTSQVHGSYTSTVQKTLVQNVTECPYPTVGIVYITRTGYDPLTIDFDTGNCYTALVNGIEVNLTEKR